MSEDVSSSAALPSARHFNVAQQRRLVVAIAAAAVGLVVLFLIVRTLLAPAPRPEEHLPANAFRPTREQLAGMKFFDVRPGPSGELIRASGSIAVDADRSTPVLLPYSGQVIKVTAELGQQVKTGDPLLSVASPELVDARNALLTASAQSTSATSTLHLAEQNAERQKALFETAGGAQKDYLQAQADLATAQSNARAASSALRAAQDRLELFGRSLAEIKTLENPGRGLNGNISTVYRAPVPGVIAERNVAPGQFVGAGGTSPLMTIADLSHVWLVAQLPESEASSVQIGDAITVTTPALPGRVFNARLEYIGAALDPVSHRLPVRASVENPGFALKPQMFASFVIRKPLQGASGLLVPVQAIIHEGDTARVWTLGKNNILYARPIVTADTQAGMTRVIAGLKAGDRIVSSGALFVNEAGLEG